MLSNIYKKTYDIFYTTCFEKDTKSLSPKKKFVSTRFNHFIVHSGVMCDDMINNKKIFCTSHFNNFNVFSKYYNKNKYNKLQSKQNMLNTPNHEILSSISNLPYLNVVRHSDNNVNVNLHYGDKINNLLTKLHNFDTNLNVNIIKI